MDYVLFVVSSLAHCLPLHIYGWSQPTRATTNDSNTGIGPSGHGLHHPCLVLSRVILSAISLQESGPLLPIGIIVLLAFVHMDYTCCVLGTLVELQRHLRAHELWETLISFYFR